MCAEHFLLFAQGKVRRLNGIDSIFIPDSRFSNQGDFEMLPQGSCGAVEGLERD